MYKENLTGYLKQAANSISNKQFDTALTIYNGILAEVPGQPDAYYGMYKIFMLNGDKKKAKNYFKEGLLKLSISVGYTQSHKTIFDKWELEYQEVFGESLFIPITQKENIGCKSIVNKLIKQKKIKQAFEQLKKCELDKELLVLRYKISKDVGLENEAILLAFTILAKIDDKDLWFEILKLFGKNGLYYDAIKICLKIINKDDQFYEAYYHLAVLGLRIEYNYEGIIHYLKLALEIKPDYNEAIALLISTYKKINYMEEAKVTFDKYVKNNAQCAYFIGNIFDFGLDSLCKDLYGIEDEVYKLNNIHKISYLYMLGIFTGKYDICKRSANHLKKVLVLEKPKIKDTKLKNKMDAFENVVAFHTIGRGGSFFFHSLIDGHKEVASYPGVYLKGYFEPGTFGSMKSIDKKEHISKFMNLFEAMFDASSAKRVPGDPMGGNINVGEKSGLASLGEDRDVVFKIDKKRFADLMYEHINEYKFMTEKEFFKIIHLVIEEIRGDNLEDKKMIFYHVHNPGTDSHFRYVNLFSNARDIVMIRNWLQSLESWMYSHIPEMEKIQKISKLNYVIRLNTFRSIYTEMVGKMEHRLFHLRSLFFTSKDVAAVKLEDVKNTPKESMKAVASWMGITYSDSLLKAEFMGLKFHSNKSKLNPTISEFDKKAIKRKVGVLFSDTDAILLNTVLRPWNEKFEYEEGEFKYVSIDEALTMNENIMDWEQKLMDFFDIKTEDALKSTKYRKQKLALVLNTQDQIKEELKKVTLIKPEDK